MQILGQMVMESNLLSVVEEQARKQQFNQNYTESQGADACYNHDTSQLQHNAARGSSMNHARRRQRAASLAPNHFAQQYAVVCRVVVLYLTLYHSNHIRFVVDRTRLRRSVLLVTRSATPSSSPTALVCAHDRYQPPLSAISSITTLN